MNRHALLQRSNLVAYAMGAGLAVALLLSLGIVGGGSSRLVLHQGDTKLIHTTDLFHFQVKLNGVPQPDEWYSPGSGSYSTRVDGVTYWFDGDEALVQEQSDEGGARADFHAPHAYLRKLTAGRAGYDRAGSWISSGYLASHGKTPDLKATVEDGHSVLNLHAEYPHDNGDPSPLYYHVVVTDRITHADAIRRGLFRSSSEPTSTTWASRPGSPTRLGHTVYWLGPKAGSHVAEVAFETQKPGEDSYLVWYADPESGICPLRGGGTGAHGYWVSLDGESCREWEVTSWPPDHPIRDGAQSTKEITLADGERAELITIENFRPVYVRTARAVVEVYDGDDDSAGVAYGLRAVAS